MKYLFLLLPLIIIPTNNLLIKEKLYYLATRSMYHKFDSRNVRFTCNQSGAPDLYLCSLDATISGHLFSFVLAPHAIPKEAMIYYFEEINKMLSSEKFVAISGDQSDEMDGPISEWAQGKNFNKSTKMVHIYYDLETLQTLKFKNSNENPKECISYFEHSCAEAQMTISRASFR